MALIDRSARILFTRLDTHGDIVLFNGFLSLLETKYANTEITLLVREGYDQLKVLFPPRIRWITTKADGYCPPEGENLKAAAVLLNELSNKKWDLLITSNYNRTWLDYLISSKLVGAKRVALGRPREAQSQLQELCAERNLSIDQSYDEFVEVDEFSHETEKYQALWEFLTSDKNQLPNPALQIPQHTQIEAEKIVRDLGYSQNKFCICAPAGTNNVPIKIWPAGKYAEIICWLEKEQDTRAVLVGHEKERAILERIESLSRERGCSPLSYVGKDGELPVLAAISLAAKLYLGNDTGLMHIAAAVGTDVIAIFGGGTWPRFLPRGKACVVVSELPCFGCFWNCIFGDAPCIESISVNDIKKAFELTQSRSNTDSSCIILRSEISSDQILQNLVGKAQQHVSKLKNDLSLNQKTIKRQEEQILSLLNSWSWKLTKPLRILKEMLS